MSVVAYQQLERKIAQWCRRQPDVLAAIVIGSRGRLSPPADDFSDLDLLLFTTEPGKYAADSNWLNDFAELWIAVCSTTGRGDPEWLALFRDGLKTDLLLIGADPSHSLAQMLALMPYQDVMQRGARLLYSANPEPGVLTQYTTPSRETDKPTEGEFTHIVNRALFAAERSLKFVHRGDPWRSQAAVGHELRDRLLTLIEWHARSLRGQELDTWYDGRFMDSWADTQVLAAIEAMDAHPDPAQQPTTVLAALDLVEWLAAGTASRLGYDFPAAGQRQTLAWLRHTARRDRR